jgi:hypothetical protein
MILLNSLQRKKILNLIKISTFIFFISLLSLLITNDVIAPDVQFEELTKESIQMINNESCSLSMIDMRIYELTSLNKVNLTFQQQILNIYPEIDNFRCLGMVTEIKVDSSNNLLVNVGSSQYVYFLFETIFFILLISLLFFSKPPSHRSTILIYIFGYLFLYLLFEAGLNFERIFFPRDKEIFSAWGYFYNVTFILFLINKEGNKLLLTFYFLYFLFIFNEYFGLFVVIYFAYMIYNNKESNNIYSEKLVKYSVVLFYILRIISGIFSPPFGFGLQLQKLWELPTQRVWTGESRYFDMAFNFTSFRNIYYQKNGLVCDFSNCDYILNGGPLSRLISFNSNPKQVAIIVGTVTLLVFIYIFITVMKKNSKETFLLACLFVSPATNFLTFTMNDDLIIGLLIYFLFNNKYKIVNKLKKIILFPLALFQIWPAIIYFGQLYVEFIKKKYRDLTFTLLVLGMFLGVNYYYFTLAENNFIFFEGIFYGFGYSSFSNLIEIITGLESSIIYYPILFFSILTAYIKRSYISEHYFKLSAPFLNSEFHTLTTLLFIAVMLFVGMIYNLPIHYFYLYSLYSYTKSNNLKIAIVLFIFLTPSFSGIVPLQLYYLISIIKDIASFYIFVVSVGYMFNSFHNYIFNKNL